MTAMTAANTHNTRQVTIFMAVKRAIEGKKRELVLVGDYETVKALDAKLDAMHAQFQQLQVL
jgi:hypothetical protein